MADNVAITAGAGTTIAADEVTRNATSEKQQIVKIGFGIDGTHDGLAAETTPLPVKQGVGTEAAYPPLGSKAFGSITASFTSLLTPGGNAKIVDLTNDTDQLLKFSFDGGTTEHAVVPAKSAKVYDFGSQGLKCSGVIHVKHLGTAPTVGTVYATVVR